jgi:glutamate N-acetyltransferase/amino-acid N-acetyltransferase
MKIKMNNSGLTAAKGFLAAGISCGLKVSGKKDLGLIVCPKGATAAAVFTTNKIVSAAVQVSREHIKSAKIYGVIVNSGSANACTGKQGIKNAISMCFLAASLVARRSSLGSRGTGPEPREILVASTGIIGHQLPIQKIIDAVPKAIKRLADSRQAGEDFTQAIMTTDTKMKSAVRIFKIDGKKVTIAGVTKGAGMIGPNMATTLCFITTDVSISKALLAKSLREAIGNSLNKLTVDGWQSTNDTAVILASGLAGNRLIASKSPQYKKFTNELVSLCEDLARQMALDAEGATKCFKVIVKGAASKEEAAKAARAVAGYDLVKCAVHGNDPNWGRIICAVGSCGVKINENKLSCKIGPVTVFRNGRPAKFDAKKASKIISGKEHTITVDLGCGKASDFCYGCDLSREYITINADYHT